MLMPLIVASGFLGIAWILERRRQDKLPLSTSEWCERMRRIGLGKK